MKHASNNRVHSAIALACAGSVCVVLSACGGSGTQPKAGAPLSPQDFVATSTTPVAPLPATPPKADVPAAKPTAAKSRDRFHPAPEPHTPSGDETLNTAALVGAPSIPPIVAGEAKPSDEPAGETVIYESLVGQINGRPVFASEVLEPLDGRLRASAVKIKDARKWTNEARIAIAAQVKLLIDEELVLAEARSALSPEQKAGLFTFLGRIQESMVAAQGGSTVAADEAARASTGRTLSQTTQDKLDELLIREEVRQRIGAKLLVTWRQIQLEYERQYDKYNPKPIANLRLIAIPTANAAAVEQIKAKFAAGETFDAVSADPSNALKGEQGIIEQPITGSLAETKLFEIEQLDAAARKLTVGAMAGPIVEGGSAWWIKLNKIDQPPTISLYDAQLEIENSLLEQRKTVELARYSSRLRARGNFSKIEDMVDKLMVIAADRYWLPTQ